VEGLTQEQSAVKKRVDLSKLLEGFIQDCKDRNLADSTIVGYRHTVKDFLEFLSGRGIYPFDADRFVFREYLHYRRGLGLDHKTLDHNFTALSTFYGFLSFEGYVPGNPVLAVRKRFLREYKEDDQDDPPRKLISVEEMSHLIGSVLNPRDRAILVLLAKTGLRRNELVSLNVSDVDWAEGSITLQRKKFKKRSGRTVFFDDECARALRRWLAIREMAHPTIDALFIGDQGGRLMRSGVYNMIVKYSTLVGLNDPNSEDMEDRFSTHCFRHFFTTHLRRAGMPREFIQVLRGDRRREAIDIYDHVDRQELRKSYLACVPKLGI
jgi:integrase/recombinase XerD